MGLLQRAAETYDNMSHLAGVETEGKGTLAPVGFMTVKAQIEITLNAEGEFVSACRVDEKITIPVTEESSGRTRQLSPHALCDQIGYISGIDREKFDLYVNQLEDWCSSEYGCETISAILRYVKKESIIQDLSAADVIHFDEEGNVKDEKAMVCWRVLGNRESDAVWKDVSLMRSYLQYYQKKIAGKAKNLCYVTGKYGIIASQHLKGVVPLSGNAKIISANDDQNFTYRGRFTAGSEAATVGYEASQKAHNALKWIVENDGVIEGGRTFVCWNPKGKEVPRSSYALFSYESEEKPSPDEYHAALAKILEGYAAKFDIGDQVIVASFDAATTGRLSVTYYNEIGAFDFLKRLGDWDKSCCWYSPKWGTSSPALKKIVDAAFGIQRGDDEKAYFETDDKVKAQQMQRLLFARIEGAPFPSDIMRAAVQKCSRLQIYNRNNRENLLFTVCAIIKKFRYDHYKEEWNMALEPERKDRSYQYGRLLAVMEKIERDTYENDEKREPNAIRLQSVFVKRPAYASRLIMEQLKSGYYPRLSVGGRNYYERLIGEIMTQISDCGEEDYNKPLSETYLLGYYLQKNSLYSKKTENQTNDANHEMKESEEN